MFFVLCVYSKLEINWGGLSAPEVFVMLQKSVFYTRTISPCKAGKPLYAASALAMLLLSAALLLASCANAVDSRGGPLDAGGGASRGSNSSGNVRGG